MQYRREIDGLRAFAVIPVILFHAGFKTFSGGFVGVDVFFVISGYLITTIILAELSQGHFSIVNFYERRARRILPALFLVMLVSLLLAWVWLLPQGMRGFSQSLVAVSVFSSNILFALTSGYFNTSSELKPLLHTWSLAVEEQYYVLFPIFLLLTWRLGRRWTLTMLAVAFFVSIALAQLGSGVDPSSTFYLLPSRGWELLVGAFVAFHLSTGPDWRSTGAIGEVAGAIGLLMLIYAIVQFDKNTPFPSLYTLVPTLGSVLIILFATEHTVVGKVIGNKVLVGIGLISYSVYLWHQPLFAYARQISEGEPSKLLFVALIIASIVLAYISWKYVETPFRSKRRFSRKEIFSYSLIGTIFFVSVGLAGHFQNGFDFRLSPEQRSIAAYADYDFSRAYRRYDCFLEPKNTYKDFSKDCANGSDFGDSQLLWGDSYMAALSAGMRKFGANTVQYTASSCPPVVDTIFLDRPHCFEINEFVKREVRRLHPALIFLHANWYDYPVEDAASNIVRTLNFIAETSPSSKVVIVGGVPQWDPSLPIFALREKVALDRELYLPMKYYNDLFAVDMKLQSIAEKYNVMFFSVLRETCSGGNCLAVVPYRDKFELAAWDKGHLTEGGSYLLAERIYSRLPSRN